jgi:hypothetical protein
VGNRYLENLKEMLLRGLILVCRWQDISDISIKGKGLDVVCWIQLAQDRAIVLS